MSDGPHRSLPLRQHWRKFAERAATPSFSLNEVAEALPIALLKDFREVPVQQISAILLGDRQISLFPQNRTGLLEAVRGVCRGSTPGTILIDCAIEASANGLTGRSALHTALENAFQAHVRGVCHSIEEHYYRKDPPNAINIRARLKAACRQVSYATLASEMVSGKPGNIGKFHPEKRMGIDEGPQL